MNVASKELCQELYKLSGWSETYLYWYEFVGHDFNLYQEALASGESDAYRQKNGTFLYPAYDLGYLLRQFLGKGGIELRYGDIGCIATSGMWSAEAATPENTVCKLLVDLFKRGIINNFMKKVVEAKE